MPIRTVVPPPVEPVTTEMAALWARATPEDTPLVAMLVKAARERAENSTHRVFVQRTMEWTGPSFHALHAGWRYCDQNAWWSTEHYLAKLSENGGRYGRPEIALVAPTQSIVSVSYLDLSNTVQTLDASAYSLDPASEPAILRYHESMTLPAVMPDRSDAVRVRFVAGYPPDEGGTQPDYRKNLPAALLAWIQIQASTFYSQRESLETGGRLVETSRNFAEALLDGLIVHTRFL